MKQIKLILILTIVIPLLLLECTDDNKETSSWTYAFYLAGDNSLENEQINNLKEIIKGNKKLKAENIIIFLDTDNARNPVTQVANTMILKPLNSYFETIKRSVNFSVPAGIEKQRFKNLIKKNLRPHEIRLLLNFYEEKADKFILKEKTVSESDKIIIKTILLNCAYLPPLDKENTNLRAASYETMRQFFSFVKDNYFTDYYAFFISGHGSGWYPGLNDDKYYQKNSNNRSPEYYDNIDPFNLKEALKHNEPDVLCLDMCLMGDIETIYQLKTSTKIIIASQAIIPSMAQDYYLLLRNINSSKPEYPEEMANTIVNTYREIYKDLQYSITTYAIKYGENFDKFINRFNNLIQDEEIQHELLKQDNKTFRIPQWSVKSMNMINLFDLFRSVNRDHIFNHIDSDEAGFILNFFSTDKRYGRLSIYYPHSIQAYMKYKKEYDRLDFSSDFPLGWKKFLENRYENK